ncbi:MAG: hypothetical protein IJY23_05470 [Clostridia bacterium]|nr:hypothetical protein [Clostridia bacterium]
MKSDREKNLSDIVVSLCADYERRKSAIRERSVEGRVLAEYIYINSKLLWAAREICGMEFAERFILDIGGRIGYAKTEMEGYSECTYKKHKSDIKINMMKRLNLI